MSEAHMRGDWDMGLTVGDYKVRLRHLSNLFIQAAQNLRDAVLSGHSTVTQQELYKRMYHPRNGDVVVEITTSRISQEEQWKRIGILEDREDEPLYSQEEWRKLINDGEYSDIDLIPSQPVYYIRTFDGHEIKWVNAMFIAVAFKELKTPNPSLERRKK